MHNRELTAEKVQHWLMRTFPLAQQRGVGSQDSLLDSGIIDSLGTLEVVTFIESEFGVPVTDEDMVADHFESIDAIARFIDSKTALRAEVL